MPSVWIKVCVGICVALAVDETSPVCGCGVPVDQHHVEYIKEEASAVREFSEHEEVAAACS